MVEFAIALSLLTAIVYPLVYYGLFFTDLAAWKSTLYLKARDGAVGLNKKDFTFLRYVTLVNSNQSSSRQKLKVEVEGEAKAIDITKPIWLFRTHKVPAKHQKYQEEESSYRYRGFIGLLIDLGEGVWGLLKSLVGLFWDLMKKLVKY